MDPQTDSKVLLRRAAADYAKLNVGRVRANPGVPAASPETTEQAVMALFLLARRVLREMRIEKEGRGALDLTQDP